MDHETQAHGLATTGGLVSSTGVAGFTLGGGIGWTMRKFGLACDNLAGADVVTADGRVIHADEADNPDLFWGLRGGGGNFGVVTSFEFDLHPVGPTVAAGPVFYPGDRAKEVMRFYRDFARDLPDELTTLVNLITAPPAPFLPEDWHGKKLIALVGCYCGDPDAGMKVLQPIRDLGDPVADLVGQMPYVQMQSLFDALWPKGTQADTRRATSASSTTTRSRRWPASIRTRPPRPRRSTSSTSAARSPVSVRTRPPAGNARRRSCSTRSPAPTSRAEVWRPTWTGRSVSMPRSSRR